MSLYRTSTTIFVLNIYGKEIICRLRRKMKYYTAIFLRKVVALFRNFANISLYEILT